MSQSFLSHLSSRLSGAEAAFLGGRLSEAESAAQDVLRDLASLTSRSRRLTPGHGHLCAQGCVCEAAVILHMQCVAEQGATATAPATAGGKAAAAAATAAEERMEQLVANFYEQPLHMPYSVFSVWSAREAADEKQKRSATAHIAARWALE